MQNPKKVLFAFVGGLTETIFFCNFYQDLENEKKSSKKNPLRRGNRSCEPLFYCAHIFYCSIVFFHF